MMAVSFFANVCDIRSLGGLVIGRTVPASDDKPIFCSYLKSARHG
jgi:hypothetical protein